MSNKCTACQGPLSEVAKFCPRCGAPPGGKARSKAALAQATAPPVTAWGQFLDDTWDFFASVKVAVVLIALLVVGAAVGSLVEQENLYQDWRPPELYYPMRYPTWGLTFMKLGLTHAYKSAWFFAIIFLCCTSLIICSLQRLIPLHRALNHPRPDLPAGAIRSLPEHVTAGAPAGGGAAVEALLKKKGYRLTRGKTGSLYGERGRLGRYGPYIIHIGLLLCAAAAFTKFIPGWDVEQGMWVADGETVKVPSASFAIRSDGFTAGYYPDGRPKMFQTEARVVDNGQEVLKHTIKVNDPLSYQGYEFYQTTFKSEPGVAKVNILKTAPGGPAGDQVGSLELDLKSPAPQYQVLPGVHVVVNDYFPDFGVDPSGKPVSKSRDIKNPVFLLTWQDDAGKILGRQALFVAKGAEVVADGPYRLQLTDIVDRHYTGLKLHKDRSFPFMIAGISIVFGGMLITFFLYHRQVWARLEGDRLILGGRTNKFPLGLRSELKQMAAKLPPLPGEAPGAGSVAEATGG